MIATYQINDQQTTVNGAILPSGFYLSILSTSKEGDKYKLRVLTEVTQGTPLSSGWDKIPGGRLDYAYTPATDNDQTENKLLTTHFEALLTEHVPGNWTKL